MNLSKTKYSSFQFRKETESIFDLKFLETRRVPLDLGKFRFDAFTNKRVNHYLIKSNDTSQYSYGEIDNTELKLFVTLASSWSLDVGLELKNRYCFTTIDQGWVDINKTLRDPGWHLDGLQGEEVPIKRPADIQFIWSDCLPTTFSSQNFDVKGLDSLVYNVFQWIDQRIKPKFIIKTRPGHIYAMNPYHPHKATNAEKETFRRFIRVSYTHIPVTSKRMTVNPDIKYNYKYHTTTGEIPAYLK